VNAINDGGSAFPTTATATTVSKQNDGDSVLTNYGSSPGMSLRVWLAGKALQGWAAGRNHSMTESSDHDAVAQACLKYADAIIRAAQEVKP
jgi:hypothetical protein